MPKIKHYALSTQDVGKTAKFYVEVFGMKEIGKIDADACNIVDGDVAEVRHKLAVLRGHCDAVGRDYDTIEKTRIQPWLLARDAVALAAKRERLAARGPLRGFVGTVSEAIDLIGQYQDAGIDLLINADRRNAAAKLTEPVPPGLGREASEGLRTGFSGDNRLGHRAHPNKAFRANEALKRKGLLGLVLRGWAARSAVERVDDHVPQSRGGTAGRINATASANARRGVPDRRLARRRRVLLWPPRPDAPSRAASSIDRQGSSARASPCLREVDHPEQVPRSRLTAARPRPLSRETVMVDLGGPVDPVARPRGSRRASRGSTTGSSPTSRPADSRGRSSRRRRRTGPVLG